MPGSSSHIIFFFFIIFLAPPLIQSQTLMTSQLVANTSTVWTINEHESYYYFDGGFLPILQTNSSKSYKNLSSAPRFACGFYSSCSPSCDGYVFVVFIFLDYYGKVVWSANRDQLVNDNATVELTTDGNLVLKDVDGSVVWSTGTSGKSVVSLNITDSGNLVLFDQQSRPVWQSFEHPTDSLLPGQTLKEGQNLTSSISETNMAHGQYYFILLKEAGVAALRAYVKSNPPQLYFSKQEHILGNGSLNMTYYNGRLEIGGLTWMELSSTSQFKYLRLDNDGHLRTYGYDFNIGWNPKDDVLDLNTCYYPTTCGNYGVCTADGQCSCPHTVLESSTFFNQINHWNPKLGCYPLNNLSCESLKHHQLISLQNTTYFLHFFDEAATFHNSDENTCRQACLKDCSCKAAFFISYRASHPNSCYLLSELFSVWSLDRSSYDYHSSVFIKVQIATPEKKTRKVILISSFLAFLTLLLAIGLKILSRRRKSTRNEDDEIDMVLGMPIRFTFEELKVATLNFSIKLGEGGFGSVYEGRIGNEMVAVKHLDGVGQGKREFLAEVLTIGNLHHVNLVRLVGFCADKSHRLLVYEFMSKGSLDKWIFYKNPNIGTLDWPTRCKIITDIAKGLSYLHEECRQRIAHLDIKPQNILLDENFNAKVSDFGLAKLMDRDQKQVMTRMRGTPGYLAPEWLTSIITEKVDIYSFGVVIMEIICGRKNLDNSQPEEYNHLITLLQIKFKANQLLDIVDSHGINVELHKDDVMNMIKLAVQCLQVDVNKRPSMSTVVQVLEGKMFMPAELDSNLVTNIVVNLNTENQRSDTPEQTASLLSGPR